uniref:Uncharacterized protein n=1 Tax=Panagrolaimus davidi TaxID=227884 RepID=A0A914PI31_9BILA
MKCIYPMLYGVFYNLSFLPIPLQCIYRYFCIYRNTQLPKWIIISIYLGILTLLIPGGYYYVIVFDPIEKDPGGYAIIKSLPFWENANGIERFCVTELVSLMKFEELLNPLLFKSFAQRDDTEISHTLFL